MSKSINKARQKAYRGFTLIELLVVIAIMGILASAGVVGVQRAVENSRVNDAAINTTAFLNRVANESSRISSALCLQKSSGNVRRIEAYKCSDENKKIIDSLELDAPMKFVNSCDVDCDEDDACDVDLLDGTSGVFKPKLGLSAAPPSGYVCAQYAGTQHYAAAIKKKTLNTIIPSVGDDEGWDDL